MRILLNQIECSGEDTCPYFNNYFSGSASRLITTNPGEGPRTNGISGAALNTSGFDLDAVAISASRVAPLHFLPAKKL